MDQKFSSKKCCAELFLTFLRIGAFTFGGGYAMLSLIRRETVENKKWITDDDILEIIAIAESTPGPIAVNSATFIGYRVGGIFGSFCATLGVVLPSFVIISLISLALSEFSSLSVVKYAFLGIRAGVLALLVKTLFNMLSSSEKKPLAVIISLGAFLLAGIAKVNVILVLALSALVGFVSSVRRAEK